MSDDSKGLEGQKKLGERPYIGVCSPEPAASWAESPDGLTKAQSILRESAIKHFNAKRISTFISKQLRHINSNEQLAEEIRYLFDEEGRPPKNSPLEDIILERKSIETQIRWLEALCDEMKNQLATVLEIEASAMAVIKENQKD